MRVEFEVISVAKRQIEPFKEVCDVEAFRVEQVSDYDVYHKIGALISGSVKFQIIQQADELAEPVFKRGARFILDFLPTGLDEESSKV